MVIVNIIPVFMECDCYQSLNISSKVQFFMCIERMDNSSKLTVSFHHYKWFISVNVHVSFCWIAFKSLLAFFQICVFILFIAISSM